jgi:hypothetical protein
MNAAVRFGRIAFVTLSLAWGIAPADTLAISLQDLFGGQTITADDKLFRNWTMIDLQTVNNGFANLNLIDVTPLVDDPLNPGVKFTAPIDGIGTPFGHIGPSSVVLTFSFDVETTNGLPLIKDNSLLVNDWVFDSSSEAFIEITETVQDASGQTLGDKQVFARPGQLPPDSGNPTHFDTATFAPQSSLKITKRINIQGPGTNDGARLLMFEQRFSQIPEPSGLAIAMIALTFGVIVRGIQR